MRYQQNIKNTPTIIHITKNNQPNKNKNNYTNANFGQGGRTTEIPVSAGGNAKWHSHFGKVSESKKAEFMTHK